MRRRVFVAVLVVLIGVGVFGLAPAAVEADQQSDGFWCWTAGYVVPAEVWGGSATPLRFRFEDEYGNYVAILVLPGGPVADFLFSAAERGAAIEIVTRAVRGQCGAPLRAPLYIYPVEDPSTGGGGGKG